MKKKIWEVTAWTAAVALMLVTACANKQKLVKTAEDASIVSQKVTDETNRWMDYARKLESVINALNAIIQEQTRSIKVATVTPPASPAPAEQPRPQAINPAKPWGGIISAGLIAGKSVRFGFDKHDVDPDQERVVSDVSDALLKNPDTRILLTGYACSCGSEDYNLALGLARAVSVEELLVRAGVNSDKIKMATAGEGQPFCIGAGKA